MEPSSQNDATFDEGKNNSLLDAYLLGANSAGGSGRVRKRKGRGSLKKQPPKRRRSLMGGAGIVPEEGIVPEAIVSEAHEFGVGLDNGNVARAGVGIVKRPCAGEGILATSRESTESAAEAEHFPPQMESREMM